MQGDDQKTDQPANTGVDNSVAPTSTGTVFAPAAADASANPYDLSQTPGETKPTDAPPPAFTQPEPPKPTPVTEPTVAAAGSDELDTIKQQALQNLTPLIDELNQSPEDKFRTMMMLIQASDNSGLIKKAYDAASAITDEKVRAQALLDVVNEINYFTHKGQAETK